MRSEPPPHLARTAHDDLPPEELEAEVLTWLKETQPGPISRGETEIAFNAVTPRSIFLKNLPFGSRLLDLGAGDGSLSIYKDWPLFARPDLKMYALSLDKGEMFDRYEAYELKNFETEASIFSGMSFEGVVCAHFIEHMQDPEGTIKFLSKRQPVGGRLYLEWPHPISKKMPPRHRLVDLGINISTTRFDDDQTHIEAWPQDRIIGLLEDNGFGVETSGRLHLPYLANCMRDIGRELNSTAHLTLGFWARFGWAQYIVASKLR